MDHNLLRIIFFGSGEFAVPTLKFLVEKNYDIPIVVTTWNSSVCKFAMENNLAYYITDNLESTECSDLLKELNADIYIVASFKMIPEDIYKLPKYGSFNVHAALLPHYRGAAPITWALANNEKETGVTTFFLEKTVDTGLIIEQEKLVIEDSDNHTTLESKLSILAVSVVDKTIKKISQDSYVLIKQNSSTKLAPKITMENRQINLNKTVDEVWAFIKAFPEKRRAYIKINNDNCEGLNVAIHEALIIEKFKECIAPPGTLVTDSYRNLGVYCKNGVVWFKTVQQEGSRILNVQDFMNGHPNFVNNYKAVVTDKKKKK